MFVRYGYPSVILDRISKKFIAKFLPESPVVIDCGAYSGDDSIEMSALWPSGTIHAFEPVPELFELLKANTSPSPNIHCHQLAISDHRGVARMYISSGASNASSSLLEPDEHVIAHPLITFNKLESVQITTFADWARSAGLSRVDFLWLDMQGAELMALKASEDLLRTVTMIHAEVSLTNTYHGTSLYPELRRWLEGKGFSVLREAIPRGWNMGNVLFLRTGKSES
jgi:FkbM family methyltransferase